MHDSTSATIRGPSVRRVVAALMVPTLNIVLMIAMFGVGLPFIRTDLGLSPDTASWLLIAYSLPSAILMPLYGRLGDRIGKRRIMLAGAVLFVGGTALLAASRTFPMLLAGRAVQGIGASCVNPLAMSLIIEFAPPKQRGKALGTWNASGPIAGIVGPLIAGGLIDAFGWRSILVPALISGVLAIIVMSIFLPESRRVAPGAAGAAADRTPIIDLSVFRSRNFSVASLVVSLRMVLRGGTGFLFPLFVTDLYHFNAAATGTLLMLDAGALLITMWLGGLVIDRRRSRVQIVAGMLLEAAAMVALIALPPAAPVSLVFVLVAVNGLGAGYTLAALHVFALTGVPPAKSATAAGLYSMIRFGGSMLGPAIGGVLLARGIARHGLVIAGYRTAFVFLLVVALAGAAMAFALSQRVPRDSVDSHATS